MVKLSDSDIDDNLHVVSMITSYTLPFVIKAVVSLGVFDVLSKAGKPLPLAAILPQLHSSSSTPQEDIIRRLLRALVRVDILEENPADCYGLTKLSKWLVKDQPMSLVPLLEMVMAPQFLASFPYLYQVAVEGGSPFEKANGTSFYGLAGDDQAFNKELNDGMNAFSETTMSVVLSHYSGFHGIVKLVDVGGGNGMCMRRITQVYPGIQGTVFDLPHVIEAAPKAPGIQYVGGNMFESVPKGDAIFIKSIFHNWNDHHCLVLLKNCYDALPANGKLIIVDMIFNPDKKVRGMDLDVMMLTVTEGKERSPEEWKELLLPHGFSHIKFIHLPTSEGIVEAYKI